MEEKRKGKEEQKVRPPNTSDTCVQCKGVNSFGTRQDCRVLCAGEAHTPLASPGHQRCEAQGGAIT